MNKNIALMISLYFITFASNGSDMPDFCDSGAYVCNKINPNYVVAYPVDKNHQTQNRKLNNAGTFQYKDTINVDLSNLTWSAFDNEGNLLRSGPVSGGKDYCEDIDRECRTVTGTYTIYRKGGENCKSSRFPVGRGGAPMPFCMFFHGGYALHGSNSVPDYNASHGCVRMSPEDAQWLNEEFVQEGLTQVHVHY